MKSRSDFKTKEEYKKYLIIYYACSALQGILSDKGPFYSSKDAYIQAMRLSELFVDEMDKVYLLD